MFGTNKRVIGVGLQHRLPPLCLVMRPQSTPPSTQPRLVLSRHSSPVTPTPGRGRGGELMRSPISAFEFQSKQPRRDDSIFQEYRTLLKSMKTLVTFQWDPENSKGTFIPIP